MQRRSFIGAGLALAAGGAIPPAAAQGCLKVIASFSILGDMVRELGGDRIEAAAIVGPDQDAHTYEPTPADAKALAASRVLVVNGLGFEGWIDRLARAAPFKGTRVVVTQGIANLMTLADAEHDAPRGHRHAETTLDPHCWQDIANGRRYAASIAAALVAADSANGAYYRERAAAYDRRLAALDAWVRQQVETVPPTKRKVITGHEAFQYFGRAYGIAFHAPVGFSTDQEASARDVASLIRLIRAEGIKAVFVENMSNPKLVAQIARDAGGVVGPALYVDALSRSGGPADTYEKMFRYNVPALIAGMLKN